MGSIPVFVEQGKKALREDADTSTLQDRIQVKRHQAKILLADLRGALQDSTQVSKTALGLGRVSHVQFAQYRRMYDTTVAGAIILNYILMQLSSANSGLQEETEGYCKEILIATVDLQQLRPLGSAHIIFCLLLAWAGCPEPDTRRSIKDSMFDFQGDFVTDGHTLTDADLDTLVQSLRLRE